MTLLAHFIVLKSHMTDVNHCLTPCTSFPSLKEESLQSSTPDGEVVILSAFLFLLWLQIIWQFFQFNDSTPSVILENELPPEGFAEVSSPEPPSESSTTSGSESEQVVKPPEKLNL